MVARSSIIAAICFLLACGLTYGNDLSASKSWTFNLYFENDLFGETDQNYTNGIRASWISPDTRSYQDDPAFPAWVRAVNQRLRFFNHAEADLQHNLVISFGQLMYTPGNIDATELVVTERPYAGYLYGGFAYHTRSNSQLDTIEINIGIIGPAALGEEAQDFIHELRGFDKFKGWDNQLRNEPGLQLLYEHKRRWAGSLSASLNHDFIAHGGLSLGNVASYVNFGGEYRIGRVLPDDFGTSAVRPGGDNSAPGRLDQRLNGRSFWHGMHLFVSFDARAVGYDIFLDGNTWRHSHSVDKERFVADLSAGVSLLLGRWKVSYAQVIRTREFRQQAHHHNYGSLSLSYSF